VGNFVDLLAAKAFQEECSEGLRLAASPLFSASRELASSFCNLSRPNGGLKVAPFKPARTKYMAIQTPLSLGQNKTTMPANRLGAISILIMYLGMI
jgi:hypothetical protein